MRFCRPDYQFSRASEITPEFLEREGYKGLLLDLDNTLLPHGGEGRVPEDLRSWVAELLARGYRLALVTNATPERVARAAEELEVPALAMAAKPLPRGFRWGLGVLGLDRGKVLVVGDQVFTDVLGGKIMGLATALVEPLAPGGLPHTRCLRRVELWCRKRWG